MDYQREKQDALIAESDNYNHLQAAYAQSNLEHDNGSFSQDLKKLVEAGRIVIVAARPAICPYTDAWLRHEDKFIVADFATRAEADEKIRQESLIDPNDDSRLEVHPLLQAPTKESEQFEQAFDDVPF